MVFKRLEKPGPSKTTTPEARSILPHAAFKTVLGTKRWERQLQQKEPEECGPIIFTKDDMEYNTLPKGEKRAPRPKAKQTTDKDEQGKVSERRSGRARRAVDKFGGVAIDTISIE